MGPVPNDYQLLLGLILKHDSDISIEPHKAGKYDGEIIVTHSPPDLTDFSPEEQITLKEVNTKFAIYTSSAIQEKTHTEPAYNEILVGDLIPYTYAESINL